MLKKIAATFHRPVGDRNLIGYERSSEGSVVTGNGGTRFSANSPTAHQKRFSACSCRECGDFTIYSP